MMVFAVGNSEWISLVLDFKKRKEKERANSLGSGNLGRWRQAFVTYRWGESRRRRMVSWYLIALQIQNSFSDV